MALSERALVIFCRPSIHIYIYIYFYRPSIVTFPLSLRVSEILKLLFSTLFFCSPFGIRLLNRPFAGLYGLSTRSDIKRGLLTYPCGVLSMRAYVLWDFVLWAFVPVGFCPDTDGEYLRNWSTYRTYEKTWSATTLSTLGEKTLVNFGPQTKKFCWLILTNQRRCFSEIFKRATDWPRLPSAHPSWDGGTPEKF